MKYSLMALVLLLTASCTNIPAKQSFYAINCGHLFDSEKGVWLKDQILLIQDGKITSLNPESLPPNIKIIDYSKSFVIPGLIDAHTHVFLQDDTYGRDFRAGLLRFMENHTDEERMSLGLQRLKSLRKTGFTSVRDLGNQGGVDISAIRLIGARLFSSGPGFSPLDGQLPPGTDKRILRKEYQSLQDPFPEDFPYDLVKVYADEDPNQTVADPERLRQWVNWAHKKGLMVAGHAILPKGIDVAIKADVDSLEHGTHVTAEQLKAMKKNNIIFVPTYADSLFLHPRLTKYQAEHTVGVAGMTCRNIRMARDLGLDLAFGSDNYFSVEKSGISFGEGTLEILLGYTKCGISPSEVIRSATFHAARTMGKEKSVGILNAGAFADFIVLRKNPEDSLEILRDPEAVYQNGIRLE